MANQNTINTLKKYSGGRELSFSQPKIIINNNNTNVVNNVVDAEEKQQVDTKKAAKKAEDIKELNKTLSLNLLGKDQVAQSKFKEYRRAGEAINRFFSEGFKGFTSTVKDIAERLDPRRTLSIMFGRYKGLLVKLGLVLISTNWKKSLKLVANIENAFTKLTSFIIGTDSNGKKVNRFSLASDLFSFVGLKQIPEFAKNTLKKLKDSVRSSSILAAFDHLFMGTKKGSKTVVNSLEKFLTNIFDDRKRALEMIPKLDLTDTGGDVEKILLKLLDYAGSIAKALFGGTSAVFDIIRSDLRIKGRRESMTVNNQGIDSHKEDLIEAVDDNTSMGDLSLLTSSKRGTFSTDYDEDGNLVNGTSATYRQSVAINDMLLADPDRFEGSKEDYKQSATVVPVSGLFEGLSNLETAINKEEENGNKDGVMVSEEFLNSVSRLAGINLKKLAKKKDFEFVRQRKDKRDVRFEGGDVEYETEKVIRRSALDHVTDGATDSLGKRVLKFFANNAGMIIGGIIGAFCGGNVALGMMLGNMIQQGIQASIGIKLKDVAEGVYIKSSYNSAKEAAEEISKTMKKNKLVLRPYTGKGIPVEITLSNAKSGEQVASSTGNKFSFWMLNKSAMNQIKFALSKKIGVKSLDLDSKNKIEYLKGLRKATNFFIEQRKSRLRELLAQGKIKDASIINEVKGDYTIDEIDNLINALETYDKSSYDFQEGMSEGFGQFRDGLSDAIGTLKDYLNKKPKTLAWPKKKDGPFRIVEAYDDQDLPALIKKYGIPMRISCGFRTRTFNSGQESWHRALDVHGHSGAYDVVPTSGYSFETLAKWISSRPEVVIDFMRRGWGILDESTKGKRIANHTGGTGDHFHIGPDTIAKRDFLLFLKRFNNDLYRKLSNREIPINGILNGIVETTKKLKENSKKLVETTKEALEEVNRPKVKVNNKKQIKKV